MRQAVNVKVKKFLFASSKLKTNTKTPFSEDDIIEKQKSPYAVSKNLWKTSVDTINCAD